MTELRGLPMADYLATPAVSAGILRDVVEGCPYTAWWNSYLNPLRPDRHSNKAQDAGTIAHSILLDGHSDGVVVIDPNDYPAEKTGNIPDGWTNKAIRTARDDARAAGKVPVLAGDFVGVQAMVDSAWRFLNALATGGETERRVWSAFQNNCGDSELTYCWQDGATACRIRPDRIHKDRDLIIDYKTGGVSAEPFLWGRTQMQRMGHYIGAAFYRRGVSAVCGVSPEYVYLVQEQEPPYLCSLVGVDATHFAIGDSKIESALAVWEACVKRGSWPMYPAQVIYPEMPAYETARWEEQLARDQS